MRHVEHQTAEPAAAARGEESLDGDVVIDREFRDRHGGVTEADTRNFAMHLPLDTSFQLVGLVSNLELDRRDACRGIAQRRYFQ